MRAFWYGTASPYLQQVGQFSQQVSPQQSLPQQSSQHVGHLSQHSVPQQVAAAGAVAEAPANPAKAAMDITAVRRIVFMGKFLVFL